MRGLFRAFCHLCLGWNFNKIVRLGDDFQLHVLVANAKRAVALDRPSLNVNDVKVLDVGLNFLSKLVGEIFVRRIFHSLSGLDKVRRQVLAGIERFFCQKVAQFNASSFRVAVAMTV